MNFPGRGVRSEREALGLAPIELSEITGVRLAVIKAYEDETIVPCDETMRKVVRALAKAWELYRLHGRVPLDENTVRLFREHLVV